MLTRASVLAVALVAGCGGSGPSPQNDLAGGGGQDLAGTGGQDLAKGCPACAGMTPFCDPMTLQCVACLKDGDCGDGMLCMMGSCHAGCSAVHSACQADAGACDVDLGVCRGCLSDGECGGASPRCDGASGRCVACLPQNDNCAKGSYCLAQNGGYGCAAGCKAQSDCPGGDGGAVSPACCNHVCVDTASDSANCGTCGKGCNGASCCAASCIDLTSDVKNCGGCGNACSLPNATPSCVQSACAVQSCTGSFADCNKMPSDGCEVDTSGDVNNCGMCGMACLPLPNAVVGCRSGGCQIAGCDAGFSDCDKQVQNGCESNNATDPNNCGMCGLVCPAVPNGAPGCIGAKCGVGACNAGFGDCDGNPANGCEVNLLADPNHCGGCGTICSAPHATTGCAGGGCKVASCAAGFGDCNNVYGDGCEVTLAVPCGACGAPCTGSDRSCKANSCVVCGVNEVGFGGLCYYLDGSGGCCANGFARAPQAVLASIGPLFAGKNYKTTVSSNCCIWAADATEGYGMAGHCNVTGPFVASDVQAGGAGCNNVSNFNNGQLTLCGTGVSNEVPFGGHCYYLDGSNSACDPGYALASQTQFPNIATQFVGKLVKHTAFNNCCIANADGPQNYGMGGADCANPTGPWATGPVAGAAGCTNVNIHNSAQLSLCGSP